MSGEAFLDSNIFIYAFDKTAMQKRELARSLIRQVLRDGAGIISYQVVQEVLNVLTRKVAVPMSAGDAARYLASTLEPLWRVQPSAALLQSGLSIQARYQFGFYDALIVAAALVAGCSRLYSEDLRHGQMINELTIINPFKDCVAHESCADYGL
ncbi:MAG TPA: PIN domain-containing protein [Gammaproteobacteria bacterium]|nr:PIN domain-containing protein [Gammaproteobacteria bacterium]